MFEDSTFDSAGRIRTRSRRWMAVAFTFNASILLAFVLIPLICPSALPRQALTFLMVAPMPSASQPFPQQAAQSDHPAVEMQVNPFVAPRMIPPAIVLPSGPEPPLIASIESLDPNSGVPGGTGPTLPGQYVLRVVHPVVKGPLRVSGSVEQGFLLRKTMPVYPAIAQAARMGGTVIVAATISKTGTIENLHVMSGPAMLQQAALNAVKNWLYRPYLLDGQPVEVETTVNVTFSLDR